MHEEKSIGFAPVVEPDTRLVILGSFPSRVSLQAREYYAFARNQFWPIMGAILGQKNIHNWQYEEKLAFLKQHKLGLWDVYQSCIRAGSLDANITAGEPNDLSMLKVFAPQLELIVHNGKTSAKFMQDSLRLGVRVVALPSTSPAYASMRFAEKVRQWRATFQEAGITPNP